MKKDFDMDHGARQEFTANAEQELAAAKEKLHEGVEKLRHGAEKLNSGFDDRFNAGREVVADKLHKAAEGLQTGSHHLAETAERAAHRMEAGADCLSNYDATALRADMKSFLTRYPVPTLVGTLAAGVLLGRAFRR